MIRGQLEASEPGLIAGWALDASDPSARLRVEIYLDDIKLGETIAAPRLQDDEQSQGAAGHAFEVALSAPIAPEDQRRVRAVITPVVEIDSDAMEAGRALIERSGLFDPAFYGRQVGHHLTPPEMIRHYLLVGEDAGARPHPLFDPSFVREQLAAASVDAAAGTAMAAYLSHPELPIDPHPLFDAALFRRKARRALPAATALEQYLYLGETWDADECPCVLFDPAHYLRIHPDVARSGMDPLVHYAAFGAWEDRSPHPLFSPAHFRESLHRLAIPYPRNADLLAVYLRDPASRAASTHPLFGSPHSDRPLTPEQLPEEEPSTRWFSPAYYRAQAEREHVAIEGSALLHYLEHGLRLGFDPHPLFSLRHYVADYPDSARGGLDPLLHFVEAGGPGRTVQPGANARFAGAARTELWLGPERRASLGDNLLDPHELFEAALYAVQRPGRLSDGESPLAHYARSWGLSGLRFPPWGTALHPRRGDPDEHGPFDVLFISHELSRTGAPAILLKIIEDLTGRRGVRGLTLALSGGERLDDFREWTPVVDMAATRAAGLPDAVFLKDLIRGFSPSARPKLVIANTACVDEVAAPFAEAGIPVVTLVHEIASGFEARVFENIYACSKQVIYPAAFVRDEAHRAHLLPQGKDAVAPQGLLDPNFGQLDRDRARRAVIADLGLPDDAVIVLGAGTIDLRKGVDVFIRVAASVLRSAAREGDSRPIHFVWLGDGDRRPHTPFGYFMEDARRLGVAGHVHFPGGRANPEPYFVASDAFMLPSRLDPFPCVVHEAMACSKPVVAFAGAGGAPEALAGGAGVVVDYGDIEGMAAAVWNLTRDAAVRRAMGERARSRVSSAYVFTEYVDRLVGLIAQATDIDLGPPASIKVGPKGGARRILFTASRWEPSGQTRFVGDLIHGLRRRGFDAELVLTTRDPVLRAWAQLPDVPTSVLPVTLRRATSLREIWQKLATLLEGAGDAVFAPVFDDVGEALIPVAPPSIGVLSIAFEHDAGLGERLLRVARYCQRIVAPSPAIAQAIRHMSPSTDPVMIQSGQPPSGIDMDRVCDLYAAMLDEMFSELRAGAHARPPPPHVHPQLGGMSLPPSLVRHPDLIDGVG